MNERSNAPQTLGWEPLDSEHILACQRVALPSVLHLLPQRYIDGFQKHPNACCKEHHNLEIEAWWSNAGEKSKGTPDIYKFYCKTCNACHVRFCVGGNHPESRKHTPAERPDLYDLRPFWEVR